jgi:hypothetical protein
LNRDARAQAIHQWRFFWFPGVWPSGCNKRRSSQEQKFMNTTLLMKVLYCGIEVELICQMSHCSLVRFKERSFVVDTADLVLEQNFKGTAKRASKARAA